MPICLGVVSVCLQATVAEESLLQTSNGPQSLKYLLLGLFREKLPAPTLTYSRRCPVVRTLFIEKTILK